MDWGQLLQWGSTAVPPSLVFGALGGIVPLAITAWKAATKSRVIRQSQQDANDFHNSPEVREYERVKTNLAMLDSRNKIIGDNLQGRALKADALAAGADYARETYQASNKQRSRKGQTLFRSIDRTLKAINKSRTAEDVVSTTTTAPATTAPVAPLAPAPQTAQTRVQRRAGSKNRAGR